MNRLWMEVIEMMLKYEVRCPRCNSKFITLIDADRFYNGWKEIGKKAIYRCDNCNNIFGYYTFDNKQQVIVAEISLNNS